jgi:hypothetical protein
METSFDIKCEILGDIWIDYRKDKEFQDFISYNDLGLPMAYMVSNDLISLTDAGKKFIEEAWELLLGALEIEDRGFIDINDMFS